ncbi:hypothetical protein HDU97_008512 [Phlyctochytrium planicorne]|nr:hypothetical protein HDU97_008512 [Phlyctochytrium planicorne]
MAGSGASKYITKKGGSSKIPVSQGTPVTVHSADNSPKKITPMERRTKSSPTSPNKCQNIGMALRPINVAVDTKMSAAKSKEFPPSPESLPSNGTVAEELNTDGHSLFSLRSGETSKFSSMMSESEGEYDQSDEDLATMVATLERRPTPSPVKSRMSPTKALLHHMERLGKIPEQDENLGPISPFKRPASSDSSEDRTEEEDSQNDIHVQRRGSMGKVITAKKQRVSSGAIPKPSTASGSNSSSEDDLNMVAPAAEGAFPINGHHAISRARGELISEALNSGTDAIFSVGRKEAGSEKKKSLRSMKPRRRSQHAPIPKKDYFTEWSKTLKQPSLETEATMLFSMISINTSNGDLSIKPEAVGSALSSTTLSDTVLALPEVDLKNLPYPVKGVFDVVDAVWNGSVEMTARAISTLSWGLIRKPARWLIQGIDNVANKVARVSVPLAAAAVLNARAQRH